MHSVNAKTTFTLEYYMYSILHGCKHARPMNTLCTDIRCSGCTIVRGHLISPTIIAPTIIAPTIIAPTIIAPAIFALTPIMTGTVFNQCMMLTGEEYQD